MYKYLVAIMLLCLPVNATDFGGDASWLIHQAIAIEVTLVSEKVCSMNELESLGIIIAGSIVKEIIDVNTGSYWNTIDILWGVSGWVLYQVIESEEK